MQQFSSTGGKPLGTDSHRTIFKRSSECWLLIRHKFIKRTIFCHCLFTSFTKGEIRHFHVHGSFAVTAKKCTKKSDARAKLLFCLVKLLLFLLCRCRCILEFLLSSKFPTETIPVRDNNNNTAYAIACSLEAARRLLSKLNPQLQRCKPRKVYETNKGKLNLGENQRASTG